MCFKSPQHYVHMGELAPLENFTRLLNCKACRIKDLEGDKQSRLSVSIMSMNKSLRFNLQHGVTVIDSMTYA